MRNLAKYPVTTKEIVEWLTDYAARIRLYDDIHGVVGNIEPVIIKEAIKRIEAHAKAQEGAGSQAEIGETKSTDRL